MINNSKTCSSYLVLDASKNKKKTNLLNNSHEKKCGTMCSETPLIDTSIKSTLFLGTNYKLSKT